MRDILMASKSCSLIFDSILAGSQQSSKECIQFVLDCSSLPPVIQASQVDSSVLPHLFKVTRTLNSIVRSKEITFPFSRQICKENNLSSVKNHKKMGKISLIKILGRWSTWAELTLDVTSWGWAVPSSLPNSLAMKIVKSASCDVVCLWCHFPVRSFFCKFIILWGHLPVTSTSFKVFFLWGRLPVWSPSWEFVFLWGPIPVRLSSCEVIFLWCCLPVR